MVESGNSLLEWLQLAAVVLLGIVSYFLKRSLGKQDSMEEKIQALETRVAILLDRDRRRRLEDYERDTPN